MMWLETCVKCEGSVALSGGAVEFVFFCKIRGVLIHLVCIGGKEKCLVMCQDIYTHTKAFDGGVHIKQPALFRAKEGRKCAVEGVGEGHAAGDRKDGCNGNQALALVLGPL